MHANINKKLKETYIHILVNTHFLSIDMRESCSSINIVSAAHTLMIPIFFSVQLPPTLFHFNCRATGVQVRTEHNSCTVHISKTYQNPLPESD